MRSVQVRPGTCDIYDDLGRFIGSINGTDMADELVRRFNRFEQLEADLKDLNEVNDDLLIENKDLRARLDLRFNDDGSEYNPDDWDEEGDDEARS